MIRARTPRSLSRFHRRRTPRRHARSAEAGAVHPPPRRGPSAPRRTERQPTPRWLAFVMITACLSVLALPAGGAGAGSLARPAPDDVPRVDLRVLLLDDGSPATTAIRAELTDDGTPFTAVDLTDPDRRRIDAAFLSGTDTATGGRPWARFQGVVAPNEAPAELTAAETEALADYRARFDIPRVNAYVYPTPEVGLNWPSEPGYVGTLDGMTAEVTAEGGGAAGPFGYLEGPVPFGDLDPDIAESYAALAVPLAELPPGHSYTSLLQAPIPGTDAHGSLVGEYVHDGGLRDLVVTFDYNAYQQQFHLLARGIVDWLTDGVRLGQSRYYFSVHIDDVLGGDSRWSAEHDCTAGDAGCPATPARYPPIRMTADDARNAEQWQRDNGLHLDMAYNAGLGEEWREANGGVDPLAEEMLASRESFRWLNHTYGHLFLGCVRDYSVDPWRCATNPDGSTRWVDQDTIAQEIRRNLDWAAAHDVTVDATELVTGEHSGLARAPEQPEDNPNLAPALAENGVRWIASDNSLETEQRAVGEALTVPRHPMNIFYNTGTEAEQVDLYNWIYTRTEDGGSGACESDDSCLPEPLDPETGFEGYIVPTESRIALDHVLAGDPRPHYVHQSNLAEDRLLYPVLDRLLARYDALFGESAPLVNPSQREAGEEMARRAAWRRALAEDRVTAYRIGSGVTVTVEAADGGEAADVAVPATVPAGTTVLTGDGESRESGGDGGTVPFAEPYAGARAGWSAPGRTPHTDGGTAGLLLTLPSAPSAPSSLSGALR
ncbi:hypothetical protein ACTWP5_13160 [Streptomyces sp. 4N509B]|uniref:hypothetical protein n=1 Tax=Streptomyces sp. 4N509B TaxID=3457413 RepID=UPI003FD50D24